MLHKMSFIAIASLQLLTIIGMFAIGESVQSRDIDCLRSVKESLVDPLGMLSTWEFDNHPGDAARNFTCSFSGVECWHTESDNINPNTSNVLSIDLRGFGLEGEFPRAIASCSSLTGLDLSNNRLHGSIPRDISRLLVYITNLDLSSNRFSGEIPLDMAKCEYLNSLNLDNNLLTGWIPEELSRLQRLRYFSVANNDLSGSVPAFPNDLFPGGSYANNTKLCGYPLDPCESRSEYTFLGGFFVGWALFFGLSLGVGVFTTFWERIIKLVMRRQMAAPRSYSTRRMDGSTTQMLERFATRMSFLELSYTTDEFSESNVIAAGETGATYKATLSNGFRLAVKRLIVSTDTTPHAENAFRSEIMTLGRLRHRSLVPLLGFCHEPNHRLLVYKFIPNGSLHDSLFSSTGRTETIQWPVRVKIAVGVAKGIAWLHQNRVVHRGISSKCILLDENFEPKISGFKNGIMPNEACPNPRHLFSEEGSYKQDIHGFGTMLLELVTGIPYEDIVRLIDIDGNMCEQIPRLLINAPEALIEQGFGDEMLRFLKVAAKCVECDHGNWPSMEQVYEMLMGTIDQSCDDSVEEPSTWSKNEIELADSF